MARVVASSSSSSSSSSGDDGAEHGSSSASTSARAGDASPPAAAAATRTRPRASLWRRLRRRAALPHGRARSYEDLDDDAADDAGVSTTPVHDADDAAATPAAPAQGKNALREERSSRRTAENEHGISSRRHPKNKTATPPTPVGPFPPRAARSRRSVRGSLSAVASAMAGSLASSEWAVASGDAPSGGNRRPSQDEARATRGREKLGSDRKEQYRPSPPPEGIRNASTDGLDTILAEPPTPAAGETGQDGEDHEKSPKVKESQSQGLRLNTTGTTDELDAILADLGPDVPRNPRADEGRRRGLGPARILDGNPSPRDFPPEDPYRLRAYLVTLAEDEIFVPALPSRVSTRRRHDAGEGEAGGDVSVARTEVSGLTEPEAAVAEASADDGADGVRGYAKGGDALARYRGEAEETEGGEGPPVQRQGGLLPRLVQLLSACGGCFYMEHGDPSDRARGTEERGKRRQGSGSAATPSTTGTFAEPAW